MTTALLFPGQGLHFVGMGQALAEAFPTAARVFAEVDDALGYSLSKLAWCGPSDELTLTANAQPAILTHAVAALRVLEERVEVSPQFAVGHSLGEWTALVAADVLDLAAAARLVHLRGALMQAAVAPGVGAMAAVLGLDRAAIEQACAVAGDVGTVVIATENDAVNTVISGHVQAVARASVLCTEAGALKVVMLPVSAPFHSPLMAPAATQLAAELAGVPLREPRFAVISTVNAQPATSSQVIRRLLVQQMTEPVRWQGAIAALAGAGVSEAWALGPAAALPGMVKRTARGIKVRVVGEPTDFSH